jgi:hypothetical protein
MRILQKGLATGRLGLAVFEIDRCEGLSSHGTPHRKVLATSRELPQASWAVPLTDNLNEIPDGQLIVHKRPWSNSVTKYEMPFRDFTTIPVEASVGLTHKESLLCKLRMMQMLWPGRTNKLP